MRIGLLTTSFPRFRGDIPGQFVLGFAEALAARGHALEVLAPEPHDGLEPPRFDGVTVRWVRYAPRAFERTFYGAGVLDNLRHDPRALVGLAPFVAQLLREAEQRVHAWDALVSHWALPCALIAGLVARGRPHLAVLHSADVFLLERLPFKRHLSTKIARNARALVCSSRNLRERFLAQLAPIERVDVAARTHVCAMGIEPAPEGTANAPKDGRLVIASLGRLVAIKGLEQAIRAVAPLPDVELAIAGDGPARADLERLARHERANVRFVGTVVGREKSVFLRSAHAFVVPSIPLASGRTEGMPTSVLEAMDHGLPVVASHTGGIADVVRHEENGLLVPPGDVLALRAAIERLKSEAWRERLANEARETAAQYHWSVLGPLFEELLLGS